MSGGVGGGGRNPPADPIGHLHYGISPLNRNALRLKCQANPNRSSESGVTTK